MKEQERERERDFLLKNTSEISRESKPLQACVDPDLLIAEVATGLLVKKGHAGTSRLSN